MLLTWSGSRPAWRGPGAHDLDVQVASLHVCLYVHLHAYAYVYVYVYWYVYIYNLPLSIHIYISLSLYIYIHIYTCTCICLCKGIRIRTRVYVQSLCIDICDVQVASLRAATFQKFSQAVIIYGFYYHFNNLHFSSTLQQLVIVCLKRVFICLFQADIWNVGCWINC